MLEIQSQVHQNLMKKATVAIIVRMFTYVLNEDTI